jgi:hypothetical protein
MAFLLGAALIFGGLLGLRCRSAVLILALPVAFLLPIGLALVMETSALQALAWAFLASVAVQLGFLAGGVVVTKPDGLYCAPANHKASRLSRISPPNIKC